MLWRPDIRAEITLLPTSQGGRKGPTRSDWFGCILSFNGDHFDVRFDLSEVGSLSPGQSAIVPATFLSPELLKGRLAVGSSFTLWEGRTIGSGRIVAVVFDRDRSYVTENDAERVRLKALVARFSDAEMAQPISPKWTVGVALTHLAFWDRLWLAKFEEWERTGVVEIPQLGAAVNGINDGMLPWWLTIAPAQVRYETIAAAEAVDNKAANLPESVVQAILAVRPRTLVRAIHRREHLDKIEQALAELR